MYIIDNFIHCLKNYVVFQGRATRSEYWVFGLTVWIIHICFTLAGAVFDIAFRSQSLFLNVFSTISGLFFFLPQVSVAVRRLHDIGKSGWYYLFVLIPIVGWIILCVYFCTDSDALANEYGENPKNLGIANQVPPPGGMNLAYQNRAPGMSGMAPAYNGMVQFNVSPQTMEPEVQNRGKIIRVFNENVSVGMSDGSFFVVNVKELDFIPFVGDTVFVFSNGDQKLVSKTPI